MRSFLIASSTPTRSLFAILLSLACWSAEQPCAAFDNVDSEAAATIVEKDATVFGFKLHYREAGDGRAVILLHGLGGDGSRWGRTMSFMADDFHMIALDQIGFGESNKPLANYNHELLAEFLAEFMNTIGVSKASLVGHSMGAWVAMYVAVHHPDMVDRLILVDGGSLTNPPRSSKLIRMQNGTTLAATREYFELMFYDKSRVTDQIVRDNYIRRLRVAYTIDKMQESRAKGIALMSEEQARGIAVPTLILWGKHDELLKPSDAAMLDRAIRDSRLVLIDECGHIPQVEQPQEFNRLVREFLLQPDAAPAGRRGADR